MFDNLTDKLNQAFKKLRGYGKLTEKNIEDGLREVRMALLEADVHYKVAKDLLSAIRDRAVGQEVLASLTPGQQVVKIVNEELSRLMGQTHEGLSLSGHPAVLMLAGLQGSGKTTTAGKLAKMLQSQHRRPYLVPADVNRPAAIAQLQKIGQQLNTEVFPSTADMDPVEICRQSIVKARQTGADCVIIDTAGRLHIDEALMAELQRIKEVVQPSEILLVADAMTGQDAVNIATTFNGMLDIGGVILTKMDGDARGGAAISIRAMTSKPIKFIGLGEKLDALEPFHPGRMASRILGMGDVLSLIEKAQGMVDQQQAEELSKKLRKNEFTLQDFRDQMVQVRKMGPLEDLLAMIPGMQKLKQAKNFNVNEKELTHITAIIDSMTVHERRDYNIIDASRRKRIAAGSGTSVQQVNQLLKNYLQALKMIKKLNAAGLGSFGKKGLRRFKGGK